MKTKYAKILLCIAAVFSAIAIITTSSCTKHDQVLDLATPPPPPPVPGQGDTLNALKVTTAPTVDGVVDAAWANADKLTVTVTVPDPGNDYFQGYEGNVHTVSMRSMYDANKIYFLMEWNDAQKSLNREPWYFDPATKTWNEESRVPTFDNAGNKTREPFYEDKFGILWNINNSSATFNSSGCYASCHTSLNPSTHGDATARHYTNSATEFIEMWHWKLVRTGDPSSQFDDQYQNNDEYGASGGRKSDPKVSGGYSDNVQTLPVTGGAPGQTMDVPKYVIPGATNYYWILLSDQTAGVAKLITAVDTNGVLSYSGGTIDPNTDVEYQRNGASTGTKCPPSVYNVAPFVGDRGDITSVATYTGAGWILEFSRSLTTPSGVAAKTDVQFDVTNDYAFGIGVFDNAAIAHAINPLLHLHFKK